MDRPWDRFHLEAIGSICHNWGEFAILDFGRSKQRSWLEWDMETCEQVYKLVVQEWGAIFGLTGVGRVCMVRYPMAPRGHTSHGSRRIMTYTFVAMVVFYLDFAPNDLHDSYSTDLEIVGVANVMPQTSPSKSKSKRKR